MTALTVTVFQFEARLSEWLPTRLIYRHRCEVLSLYCAGYSVAEVARYVRSLSRG